MTEPMTADILSNQGTNLTRRSILLGAAAMGVAATARAMAFDLAPSSSLLVRVKAGTIASPDPKHVAEAYMKWLDYRLRDSGRVGAVMAASWGAPDCAGRPFYLLSSDGYPDVFLRVVGIDPVPGYKAWTTRGWNSFEIMVDDANAMYESFRGSPFKPLAKPYNPVKEFPAVFSMDVVGPGQELLFIECQTGNREKAYLPLPRGKVGRPHLTWVSGPEIVALRDWYADSFSMPHLPVKVEPVESHEEGKTKLNTLLFMRERGNSIQFDDDPAQLAPRPQHPRQLPPGNAMASFSVASLDAIKLPFITPPLPLYGALRAATVRDPQGNRIELIEEVAR
jgi:catechol 2,3-dioxygenase-like lactoylglutathione lyase family enzyme